MRHALLALLLAACGSSDPSDTGDPPPQDFFYYQDVKPIFDAKCVKCHADGGIAPMDLRSYAAAVEYLGREPDLMGELVSTRAMPPWPPNNDCATYQGDRSLTEDQIATIVGWLEGGAREGDPAAEGAALTDNATRLSREDLTLSMPAAFTPTRTPDEYRCFVLPWPEEYTTTKYVTGFRANPGNPEVVHHIIAFTAAPSSLAEYQALDDAEEGPGYTCFGGPVGTPNGSIGGWAPGNLGADLPEGTGIAVEPGTLVILQVHYNVALGAFEDLSSVSLKIDDTVATPVRASPWTNPTWLDGGMLIPADQPDVTHAFEFDANYYANGSPMNVFNATLHMHTRGTHAKLSIERADGSSDCLLQIDNWDFHWQGSYAFVDPKVVMPGDSLRIECHWDNTAENQPVVDGDLVPVADLNWGEGTGDEMCIGFFLHD